MSTQYKILQMSKKRCSHALEKSSIYSYKKQGLGIENTEITKSQTINIQYLGHCPCMEGSEI